jgi:hypothetical protein
MKWLVYVLLAVEVLLLVRVLAQALASDLSVLLLAGNSILLIWSASRSRRESFCCQ